MGAGHSPESMHDHLYDLGDLHLEKRIHFEDCVQDTLDGMVAPGGRRDGELGLCHRQ